jgi:hypothetical protein
MFVKKTLVGYTSGYLARLGIGRKELKSHLLAGLNDSNFDVPYNYFPEFANAFKLATAQINSSYENKIEFKFSCEEFINIHVRNYFAKHRCPLISLILAACEKISSLKYFWGRQFPQGITKKTKVN